MQVNSSTKKINQNHCKKSKLVYTTLALIRALKMEKKKEMEYAFSSTVI